MSAKGEDMKVKEISEIDIQEVLDFAIEAGRILLRNGAEIFRVEETMIHICRYYEVPEVDTFVLSNGIFLTAQWGGRNMYSKIKYVPLEASHLGIVAAVNDLSRQVCAGKVPLKEAKKQLAIISEMPEKKAYFKILAAGFGSASFCYLLDGTLWESFFTILIAMALYVVVIFCENNHLSKLIKNTIGGAFVSFLAVGVYSVFGEYLNMGLDNIIIGSVLPLVPGMAFVNSIRDIANSDILSGMIRLVDTVLVFVYIAIGVGTALSLCGDMIGGVIL